jgi:hypothetical protein
MREVRSADRILDQQLQPEPQHCNGKRVSGLQEMRGDKKLGFRQVQVGVDKKLFLYQEPGDPYFPGFPGNMGITYLN